MKKIIYLLLLFLASVKLVEAAAGPASEDWTLFKANSTCLKRVESLRALSSAHDEPGELNSNFPEISPFVSACNHVLIEKGFPSLCITGFSYLLPNNPLPDVAASDTVSLDFEFANDTDKAGYKSIRVFSIKSLQLLVNRHLYVYDFNREAASEDFTASLRALCSGQALKLVFGGESDIALLSKLSGLGGAELSNVLDIQKMCLVTSGAPQLGNLHKTLNRNLSIQLEAFEGYRKIEFYEWLATSGPLKLEHMIHGVSDVIFLAPLLISLDFDMNPRLWSRYNSEMQRYYGKALAQAIEISSPDVHEGERGTLERDDAMSLLLELLGTSDGVAPVRVLPQNPNTTRQLPNDDDYYGYSSRCPLCGCNFYCICND